MCGIGGFLSLSPRFDLSKISESFRDGLLHRGPDYQGDWFSDEESLMFSHARLSILDLSENANQPMKSGDGNIVITFNGEIYNYAEIKAELIKKGHSSWITDHSDTEVIIHAYKEWGIDCIKRFRGMFAFGLWDNKEKALYLVRDRFGVKPVYYISKSDHFGFSSEIKPFFTIYANKRLNNAAVLEYLTMRGSLAPNTMVQDIFKLDKGCYLKIEMDKANGTLRQSLINYYGLEDYLPKETYLNMTHNEIVEELEQQLITSIKYRWIADTPVCLFLSGGLDSSLLAAISSKLFKEKLHAFTIGLPGDINDETGYARKVAYQYGLDLHMLDFTQNPLSVIEEWIHYNDDLFSDPAAFALFSLSKEIRKKGFKVVLSGEGSDEIFAGYSIYNDFNRAIQNSNNRRLKSLILAHLYAIFPFRRIENYFSYSSQNNFYSGAADIQTVLSRRSIVNDKVLVDNHNDKVIRFKTQNTFINLETYPLFFDLEYRIPNDLLLRTDRATMASSIEGRVPFLDHKLVEFVMSIPYSYKVGTRQDNTKLILKELALKYFEKDFVFRPKQGFPMPVGKWLAEKAVDLELKEFLHEQRINCLNYNYIKKLYFSNRIHKHSFCDRLFQYYLLEKYVRYWDIT